MRVLREALHPSRKLVTCFDGESAVIVGSSWPHWTGERVDGLDWTTGAKGENALKTARD